MSGTYTSAPTSVVVTSWPGGFQSTQAERRWEPPQPATTRKSPATGKRTRRRHIAAWNYPPFDAALPCPQAFVHYRAGKDDRQSLPREVRSGRVDSAGTVREICAQSAQGSTMRTANRLQRSFSDIRLQYLCGKNSRALSSTTTVIPTPVAAFARRVSRSRRREGSVAVDQPIAFAGGYVGQHRLFVFDRPGDRTDVRVTREVPVLVPSCTVEHGVAMPAKLTSTGDRLPNLRPAGGSRGASGPRADPRRRALAGFPRLVEPRGLARRMRAPARPGA